MSDIIGIEVCDDPIKPGDLYIAEKNTGPHLLTCERIIDGYVVPVELQTCGAYCYDIHECKKVKP